MVIATNAQAIFVTGWGYGSAKSSAALLSEQWNCSFSRG